MKHLKQKLLLTALLLLAVVNVNAEVLTGSCGANLTYTLDTETGILKIEGTGRMDDYDYLSPNRAPWYSKRSMVMQLELSYGITYIGKYAFYGNYLTSVSIPSSVTSIGENAFYECFKLASVDIPNSVTSIGKRAFGKCSKLTSIEIPNSVTSLGESAFQETGLTYISLPNSITSISDYAFRYCSSLASIDIPNSVTSIGERAFGSCSSLTSIDFLNSVTSIGEYAFEFCENIASIEIPNSVTSIGEGAFYNCWNLTSITIGNSVTSIGENAFTGCEALSMANYASIESLLSINFGNSRSNPLWYSGRLYINGVEATDLEIPNNVTSIGKHTFYNCSSLTSVIIPNSVTSIGYNAFYKCNGLTSVTIGNSVTSIGSYAFAYCNGLTSVTIRCTTLPATESGIFSSTPIQSATLYVPEGSIETYLSTSPWSDFGQILPYQATKIELTDATPVSYITDNYFDELDYTRTFNNTNWQALYVPFSMDYEDWAEEFEVARLNNVNQYDDDNDGTVDRTVLEVIKLAEGSKTEANTPYMIKAKETGEKTITVADATLYKTEETSHDVTSWETKFTFTGTYHTVTDMATNGYYALAGGRLQQATSDAVTLSPMRWYLSVTDRNGNPQGLAKSISVVIDGGETTGISEVNTITTRSNAIYSINGSYIGTDRSKLTKGIYVSGGKKIIIK